MGIKISVRQRILLATGAIVLFFVIIEATLRLGGFIFFFLQERRNIAFVKEKVEYRIMCLGESTTALGGKYSYPSQLEEILNQSNKGTRFIVINKGIPASNTTDILLQLEENLDRYKPQMVITMMGVNDGEAEPVLSGNISLGKLEYFRVYKLIKMLAAHIAAKIEGTKNNSKKVPPESLGHKILDDKEYVRLGWNYKKQGKFIEAVESFKKALELNSRNEEGFVGLGYSYLELRDFEKMEEAFKKAIEINPRNDSVCIFLGHMFYSCLGRLSEAELFLKKAIEINPRNENAYFELGWFYQQQNMPTKAIENFKKTLELNPLDKRTYGALATLSNERGEYVESAEYYKKIKELRTGYYNSKTCENYQKLKKILDRRGIKLICVQYPTRSIEPLKEIFIEQTGTSFVDNERVFKEALRKDSYKEYFTDMFGGDFGHCTPRGNRLLAENIANVVLKEIKNTSCKSDNQE